MIPYPAAAAARAESFVVVVSLGGDFQADFVAILDVSPGRAPVTGAGSDQSMVKQFLGVPGRPNRLR